jgi:hypothetical protein
MPVFAFVVESDFRTPPLDDEGAMFFEDLLVSNDEVRLLGKMWLHYWPGERRADA